MENATKALLIAGSVLIAILLIAMGMKIFTSTEGTTGATTATMDATAIATFNNQFTNYLNKTLTVNQCATLIQKMIASNATNTRQVKFKGDDPKNAIPEAGTYSAEYEGGYINNIK